MILKFLFNKQSKKSKKQLKKQFQHNLKPFSKQEAQSPLQYIFS